MKKKIFMSITMLTLAAVIILIACKKNQAYQPGDTHAGPMAVDPCGCKQDNGQYLDIITLPNVISANTTLVCTNLYRLNGKTYVTNNAVLTIPAGTRIEGIKQPTADIASALIITRGSRLFANGHVSCPIVFTSAQASPAPGDWGGIVILGRAPLNRADTTIEGIDEPSLPVGVDINYGGGGPCQGIVTDNSGVLNFVRIEYAGAVIAEGNELNGLTLGGVGSGTILQNIQVAYGADDGFQFFGGTVNARRLISFGNNDDDLDFEFGYTGKIQFVVASKIPDLAYSPSPNGIESSNTPSGNCATCKVTLDSAAGSVIINATIIGSDDCPQNPKGLSSGAFFNTGSQSHLKNSIIMDYPFGVNNTSVCTPSRVRCNVVHGTVTPGILPPSNLTFTGCFTGFGNSQLRMVNPYGAVPDYTLQSGSPALSGACSGNFGAGIILTTYRGAFPAFSVPGADWTNGWARWNF